MPRWVGWLFILHATFGGVGCANLTAKKVPLEDRLMGHDHQKGFRYYLPRPYIVVAEPQTVSRRVDVGYLVKGELDGEDNFYFEFTLPIEGDTGRSAPAYFTLDGTMVDLETARAIVRSGAKRVTYAEIEMPTPVAGDAADTTADGQPGGPGLSGFGRGGLPVASLEDLYDIFEDTEAPPAPPDAFQVVHLPDFEEQMVIKDKNAAAYSKYQLQFADGWQLQSVKGSFDSTEVAVRALQSLSNAVSVAAGLEKEKLDKLPIKPPGDEEAGVANEDAADAMPVMVARVITKKIHPGLYRLAKPSEMGMVPPGDTHGMLTELGFPIVPEVKTSIISRQ